MILTKANLHAAQTGSGGFKRAQIEALGLTWPARKGWLSRLIGTEISDEAYAKFLEARDREVAKNTPLNPTTEERLAALESWCERMRDVIYEHLGVDVQP